MNTAEKITIKTQTGPIQIDEIPKGTMLNSVGHLVPEALVKDIDKARDALVKEIFTNAQQLSKLIKAFKVKTMGDIAAFVELSAEQYDISLGGNKGNVTLRSYDGRYKIQLAIAETLVFDERLQIAKKLIDECINSWAEGADAKIRVLVNQAFQVNQQGRVDTRRILSLRSLAIADPTWQKAMEAIGESLTVAGSKQYIRIYERDSLGQYQQVNLDLAAL